jgi:hypothetical protein
LRVCKDNRNELNQLLPTCYTDRCGQSTLALGRF